MLTVLMGLGFFGVTTPAAATCVPLAGDRVEPLADLPGLPPGWAGIVAYDDDRIPAIPTAGAQGPLGTCDLTNGLGAFARLAGLSDKAALAKLAVATAYPDQLGFPLAESVEVRGDRATARAWSQRDGLVTDWTLELRTLEAHYVVRAVGVGDYASEMEGWHPWEGFADGLPEAMGDVGILATKVLMCPTGDGSQFRLTYFTQFYASEAEADTYAAKYCAASQTIYAIENGQWGFTSADPDGIYDITMDGCSCIFSGNNVNIHVHAKLEDLIGLLGLSYPTFEHFYRIVIGHEWHHHLQYSIQQWRYGSPFIEAGARFSETIFDPDAAHGPNTIQYLPNINGFSNMMLNPNQPLSARAYDFGLFFGFAYTHDGGVALLREVYEESLNAVGGTNDGIPDAFTRAFANVPGGAHTTFEAAHLDFATAMHSKDFKWGKADGSDVRDWGLYLPNANRQVFVGNPPGVAGVTSGCTNYRGIQLANADRDAPILGTFAGDPAIKARWVWTRPDNTVGSAPADAPTLINEPVTSASLVMVRGPAAASLPPLLLCGPAGTWASTIAAPLNAVP